jgi:hypothetical protein
MKKIFSALALALAASVSMAQNVYRMEYETQVPATDLSGTVFNAELLSSIRNSKLLNVGTGFPLPRLRVSVRTLTISELSTRVSVWDVLFLLDQEDGTSTYLGSWPGYSDDESSKMFAKSIASKIVKQVEEFEASQSQKK